MKFLTKAAFLIVLLIAFVAKGMNSVPDCPLSQEDWLDDENDYDPFKLIFKIQSLLISYKPAEISHALNKATGEAKIALSMIKDRHTSTVFHVGASIGAKEIEVLLLASEDILGSLLCKDKDQWTPLHVTVKYSKLDTAKVIFSMTGFDNAGLLLHAKDDVGWTPLEYSQLLLNYYMKKEERPHNFLDEMKKIHQMLFRIEDTLSENNKTAFNDLVSTGIYSN